jgi:hypothetical protein
MPLVPPGTRGVCVWCILHGHAPHYVWPFRRAFGITPAEYRRGAQETSKSASDIQDD